MRCYICNEPATRIYKTDGAPVCDECHTSVSEILSEFEPEEYDEQESKTKRLKDEDTSDMP